MGKKKKLLRKLWNAQWQAGYYAGRKYYKDKEHRGLMSKSNKLYCKLFKKIK